VADPQPWPEMSGYLAVDGRTVVGWKSPAFRMVSARSRTRASSLRFTWDGLSWNASKREVEDLGTLQICPRESTGPSPYRLDGMGGGTVRGGARHSQDSDALWGGIPPEGCASALPMPPFSKVDHGPGLGTAGLGQRRPARGNETGAAYREKPRRSSVNRQLRW
jgi:hypothetical protein